jgi:hypothetical protein
MRALIFKLKMKRPLDYECYLPAKFDNNLMGFYLYHHEDFDHLSKVSQEKMIDCDVRAAKI